MIQRKPNKRLGFNGPSEVKSHAWFDDFDWEKLEIMKITPKFKPKNKEDNFDAKNWKENESENEKMREN